MQKVARVLKSNGAAGELLVSFAGVSPEDILLEEPVFINFDGLPVPFYFESFTQRGLSKAVVRLTGVHSLKDAEELVGRDVFATYFDEDSEEEDFEGWRVMDQDGNAVGTASGYEDIPGNLCLYVNTLDGREVLLPINEELLLEANRDTKLLKLHIPEGLI